MAETPNEIFHAFCDELARWFEPKDFVYTRSRPKLKLVRGDLSLELAFWSSRTNVIGKSVALEVVSSITSKQLAGWIKQQRFARNGAIFSFLMHDTETNKYKKIFQIPPQLPPTNVAAIATEIEARTLPQFSRFLETDATIAAAIARDQSYLDFAPDLIGDNFLAWLLMLDKRDEARAFVAAWPEKLRDVRDLAKWGLG